MKARSWLFKFTWASALLVSLSCSKGGSVTKPDPIPNPPPPPPPSVPPGHLAFYGRLNGEDITGLIVLKPDGTGAVRVATTVGTLDGETDAREPVWSPDGTKFAYVRTRYRPSGWTYGSIGIMNADGSNQILITNMAPGDSANDRSPSWSPDGTKIVFSRRRNQFDDTRLWVVNLDGSGLATLTGQNGLPRHNDVDPCWSPDGTRIFYGSTQNADLHGRIYSVNPDGSGVVPVTPTIGADDGQPAFSPDGTHVAFVRYSSDNHYTVLFMNPDGTNERSLFEGAYALTISRPAWSPDSKNLAWAQTWTDVSTYRATLARMALADSVEVPVYGGDFIQVQEVTWGP